MSKQTTSPGKATPEQIKQWKEKYPAGVYELKVKGKYAYFKHPDFREMDYYHAKSVQSDSVSDQWKALAETCFVGGADELRDSPVYLPTTHALLRNLIFDSEAELVNL
jgi:hypothetical protein